VDRLAQLAIRNNCIIPILTIWAGGNKFAEKYFDFLQKNSIEKIQSIKAVFILSN